jgi:hypothetical protein
MGEVVVIEITGRLDDSEEVALALERMAARIREDDDVRAVTRWPNGPQFRDSIGNVMGSVGVR